MAQREKFLAAWNELDFVKVADDLIAAADVWENGSIDGCLVWDMEKEELVVVSESQSVATPGYIYIFSLPGNDKPDVDEDELLQDLMEFDIEEFLDGKFV